MKHVLVEIEVTDVGAAADPALLSADISTALWSRDTQFKLGDEGVEPYYGKARVLTEDEPV